MEKKKFPKEVWDPIRKSLRLLDDDLKRIPKHAWTKNEGARIRKNRAEEERKRRMTPSYNAVSGTFIDKRKRKNGRGDMPPRSRFIDRQIARDAAAGKTSSEEE